MITNQKELRAEFMRAWREHCARFPGDANDKPAMRQAFSAFIDSLARDGQISESLADRATLEPVKTKPVWRIFADYGDGPECVDEFDSRIDARDTLKEYRLAHPRFHYEIRRGRAVA